MVLIEVLNAQLISILQFIIVVAMGLIVTKLLTEALSRFFHQSKVKNALEEMGYEEPVLDLVVMILRYLLYFITFMIGLAQFGFATFVFNGIILGIAALFIIILIFSLKNLIPNASAGIYLKKVRMIEPGDFITVDNYSGKVKDLNLMTLTIEDETGRFAIIPNSNLLKKEILLKKARKANKKK